MIAIRYNDHGFGERLPRLLAQLAEPTALLAILGREAGNRLRSHFRQKDRTEPNKLGGQRTHFWRQVTDSVQAPRIAGNKQSVVVSITHPAIAQKVLGGVIRPKRVKFLTIPVAPEAYGRTARTFEAETGLKLFLLKVGTGKKSAVLATARGGGIQVEYLLRSSVKQSPDPAALPDPETMSLALLKRADGYVARKLAEATGKAGSTP
ncbi:MAG: hypothetical protein U1G08_17875 [Verrucomicrobiota bacterium]